jgi:hypothetical protein
LGIPLSLSLSLSPSPSPTELSSPVSLELPSAVASPESFEPEGRQVERSSASRADERHDTVQPA